LTKLLLDLKKNLYFRKEGKGFIRINSITQLLFVEQ